MTDATTAATAGATTLPEGESKPGTPEAGAANAAVAAPFSTDEQLPGADPSSLKARKNAALARLDEVKDELEAAYQRALSEPGWVHAVETFIEDIEVKAGGIIAWIKRHI